MINVEQARPTLKALSHQIDVFEACCTGVEKCTPERFRALNNELSVCAVLMIGKRRYVRARGRKHLVWRGLDQREYDLGPVHDANVMRDYPGFHAKRSLALGQDLVTETKLIDAPGGMGTLSVVTLQDGSSAVATDYRTALRNAVLKMHLKQKFNYFSLAVLWKMVRGHA